VLGSAVSPAKMDEPIAMPFGVKTRVIPRNSGLDGVYAEATWNDLCAMVATCLKFEHIRPNTG